MALMRFERGAEVEMAGEAWRLIDKVSVDGEQAWFVKRLRDAETQVFKVSRLKQLWEGHQLRRHYETVQGSDVEKEVALRARQSVPDALSPEDRMRREGRAKFLRRVLELVGEARGTVRSETDDDGRGASLLERALLQVSREMADELKLWSGRKHGEPQVSRATFYRWLNQAPTPAEDARGLEGKLSLRGRASTIPETVQRVCKEVMRAKLELYRDRRGLGRNALLTMSEIAKGIEDALVVEGLRNPTLAAPLAMPSRPTLYRWYSEFPAFDRAVAEKGTSRARREFRFVKGHESPEGAYELVQYDESTMPFFFIDELHGIPLGKGSLCWSIDTATTSVGGFSVSFEPFSDLTMMSTYRHACSLKAYVATEYPQIRNPWHMGGMFRGIALDNSRSAWGGTLQECARILDCERTWLPPRTPWFKPAVEGMFGTLNTMLLRHMPGFALGLAIDSKDYDPRENACIGLRQFLHILHKWLLDVYHVGPIGGAGGSSPNERWLEACKKMEPGLLDSADDLDSLFGIVRYGTLDHRGLVFENIRYTADELNHFRMQDGATQKIRFKFNPSNLGLVRAFLPRGLGWVRATPVHAGYADGLSLHVHKLVEKLNRERNRKAFIENHRIGMQELKALISETSAQALSNANGALLSRAIGMGTHNLFGTMDHFGVLGPATGPYTGSRLNPDVKGPGEPAQGAASAGGNPLSLPPTPATARSGRRPIVRLEAEDSL